MPEYMAYRKRMQSNRSLTIRGTPAEVDVTRKRLCDWLERDVASKLPFLLPPPGHAKRATAVENLRGLKLLDLMYMIAVLQEVHGVPAFPTKMQSYKGAVQYRRPSQSMLYATNKVPSYLALVPSREPDSGLGIVNACKDRIPRDEVLGYYIGIIMTVAQGERLAYKKHNAYIMFVKGPNNRRQYAINARDRTLSTWTRFVNESREPGGLANTAFMESVETKDLITVTSIKDIRPGEELLLSYR